MEINSVLHKIDKIKFQAFQLSRTSSFTMKLLFTFIIAGLTGLCAQIKIILQFTPVPISGQTFEVLIAGILLGKWWTGISQIIYAVLGILGVPWFAGFKSGLMIPTFGYILGFILSAFFIGYCIDHYKIRNFMKIFIILIFANFILIYIPGLIFLGYWLNKTSFTSFKQILFLGAVPFILGDIIKICLVTMLSKIILPNEKLN